MSEEFIAEPVQPVDDRSSRTVGDPVGISDHLSGVPLRPLKVFGDIVRHREMHQFIRTAERKRVGDMPYQIVAENGIGKNRYDKDDMNVAYPIICHILPFIYSGFLRDILYPNMLEALCSVQWGVESKINEL
jgi:hypothetical protein